MANDKRNTQIKIGPARGSYANIFKPRAMSDKDEPKYSISLLVEKKKADKQLAELRKLIEYVAQEKFGPKWKEIRNFKLPIRDGDVERPDHKEYAGMLFMGASSKKAPGIVDRHLVAIMDEKEAYSGCYFVAAVNVYAFDTKGNKGVALGLNNLLLWEKGEKLSGGKEAAEDFAEYAEGGAAATAEADENPLD